VVNGWWETLRQYPEIALFLTVGGGALVGRLRFRSVVLGSVTGTLLVGVLVGQAGVTLDSTIKAAAFAASLFALGYNVGPQFFAGLRSDGLRQVSLATISCVLALLGAVVVAEAFGYGVGWGAGLLAGGLTQSSVIGVSSAAIETLPGVSPEQARLFESQIAVAFSVCYLVSAAAGAYFLSVVAPRLLGVRDLPAAARQVERRLGINSNPDVTSAYYSVVRRAYRLEPSHLIGRTVHEAELDARARGHVLVLHRMRRADVISVLTPASVLRVGDVVTVSTRRGHLTAEDSTTFGVEIDDPELLGYDVQELPIIVTNKRFAGRTITDVMNEVAPRIFVNDVVRAGVKVPWSASTILQMGDEIRVQGIADEVESAAARIGYPLRTTPTTDLSYVGLGIALGCLIGVPTIGLLTAKVGLTTSGGALIAGLFLGYLRTRHPAFGQFPAAANWLISTGGLCLFVGAVGISAAPHFADGLREEGLGLVLGGLVVGLFPMVTCLYLGRYLFKFDVPVLLGVIAGANTTTAGIAAVTDAAKSHIPVIGYTAPYAIGNILLTLWGSAIIVILA
jgi:putative transport protein